MTATSTARSRERTRRAALDLHRKGDLAGAERAYRTLLAEDPRDADTLHLMGVLRFQQGDHPGAEEVLRAALAERRAPEILAQAGQVAAARGRHAEAIALYDEAAALKPDTPELQGNMGLTLLALGRREEAVAAFRAALEATPGNPVIRFNLGNALADLGRREEALAAYDEAVRLAPVFPEAHVNRGNVLRALGRDEEGVAAYRTAIEQRPAFPEALNNLGGALVEMGRDDEGLVAFRAALDLRPDYPEALSNVGNTLMNKKDLDGAVAACRAATMLQPGYVAAHCNAAVALLLRGDLPEGFAEYEWRWYKSDFSTPLRNFPQPQWRGEDIAGRTILLHHEQGLGDSIHFVRYVPAVAARAGTVVLEMPAALHGLFAPFAAIPNVRLVTMGEPLPPFDVHCPMLSLPIPFGTTIGTVPAAVPYLAPEPDRVEAWRARLPADGFRIGLIWQGKPDVKIDEGRSIPLAAYAPLARVPGVRLISLQKTHGLEQLKTLPDGMVVETLGDDFDAGPHAFLDTAAVMASLDLVVTSDTSVAHLAGALGRPTWVAVKAVPEWRWLLEGDDNPWYPTMRVFRQETPGDWDAVFAGMAGELAAVVGGARERLAPVAPRWAAAPEPAVVETPFRHGRIRFYRADTIIGRSLAEYGEWSEEEVAICLSCLRPGDTVLEAGANVGAHTIPIAKRLGPAGRMHSFEPQAGLMEILRQNVEINGLDNVELHRAAVGREPGRITVPAVDYGRPGNFGGVAIGAGGGTEVPLVTVDSLGLERLRLLKADVEGMEDALLEGARETIARCRPVLYLENDRPDAAEALIRTILTAGYRVWWHTPPLFSPLNFKRNGLNIFPRIVSKNILCVPAEQDAVVVGLPEVRFAEA